MVRKKTPSFITEIPLIIDSSQESELLSRFEAGRQLRYGKAISAKSPGFVQSELKRKAEIAGGSFTEFSTRKTALSQTHLNGNRFKKSLSERVHRDALTGEFMHRDIFSAYLARFVNHEGAFMCGRC